VDVRAERERAGCVVVRWRAIETTKDERVTAGKDRVVRWSEVRYVIGAASEMAYG
jgi:hypothetical protein